MRVLLYRRVKFSKNSSMPLEAKVVVRKDHLRNAQRMVQSIVGCGVHSEITVKTLVVASREDLVLLADGLVESLDVQVDPDTLEQFVDRWYGAADGTTLRMMIADVLSLDDE